MSNAMTKSTLLAAMQAAREQWDAVLAEVGTDRMLAPVLHGGWSIKDTIGHVAYYECWLERWLEDAVRGKVTIASHRDLLSVDERNAMVWNDNHRRPLADILAESKFMHDRLYQLVKLVPEADLFDPHVYERYITPFWNDARPLWKCIAGDSYEHYQEHTANIYRWLQSEGERQLQI